MMELIKKATLAGVGAAALTAEKVEELAKELIVKGKMTEVEGRKFVDEIQSRAKESKEVLREYAENAVEKAFARVNQAQLAEIKNLQQEVTLLRAEIEKIKEETTSSK